MRTTEGVFSFVGFFWGYFSGYSSTQLQQNKLCSVLLQSSASENKYHGLCSYCNCLHYLSVLSMILFKSNNGIPTKFKDFLKWTSLCFLQV